MYKKQNSKVLWFPLNSFMDMKFRKVSVENFKILKHLWNFSFCLILRKFENNVLVNFNTLNSPTFQKTSEIILTWKKRRTVYLKKLRVRKKRHKWRSKNVWVIRENSSILSFSASFFCFLSPNFTGRSKNAWILNKIP